MLLSECVVGPLADVVWRRPLRIVDAAEAQSAGGAAASTSLCAFACINRLDHASTATVLLARGVRDLRAGVQLCWARTSVVGRCAQLSVSALFGSVCGGELGVRASAHLPDSCHL